MKQDATKKSKKWILPVAIIVALLVIAGVILAIFFAGQQEKTDPAGDRAELYWNIDQLYYTENSETGLSTREPGEDGLFHVRFAIDGEQVELPVIGDKQLINYMDTMQVVGLTFDTDGVVVDVVDPKTIATELANGYYVKECSGANIQLNSSIAMNGMKVDITVTEKTGVYNVDSRAQLIGQPDTCQVMDRVIVYGNETGEVTHVFISERVVESAVYYRVDQLFNSTTGKTTREPDENGVYTILFACDGQQVELKCKDKDLVSKIDSGSDAKAHMGLVFDEDGYIVDYVNAALALRGTLAYTRYTVTAVEGSQVTIESKWNTNKDLNATYTLNVDSDCDIFLVETDCTGEFIGQRVQLQVGDMVYGYTDLQGDPVLFYIHKRQVEGPMYYNVTRSYDSTAKETKRKPDASGYYVFDMVADSQSLTLRTKSKEIASKVDSYVSKAMGLKLNGDIIEQVYDASCVSGRAYVGVQRYVASMEAGIVRIVSSSDFNSGGNFVLSADCKIYDMTGDYGIPLGTETELRVGDCVTAFRNESNQVNYVFIVTRYYEDSQIYYNIDRQYSSKTKSTKREPDAEGYYVFDMLCKDKQVTVKTKNKDLATYIDKQSSRFLALEVSGGVVTGAYKVISAIEYSAKTLSDVYYNGVKENGTVKYYTMSDGEKVTDTSKYTLADDCKIYNYSEGYDHYRGEETTLQKGDYIQAFVRLDTREIVQIFVKDRQIQSKLYWSASRMYDSTTGETTREPDADGYYVFELAVGGKVKTFKTKDKTVASKVDSFSYAFGLKLDGDIIIQAYDPSLVKGITGRLNSFAYITAIDGDKVTVTYQSPTDTKYGQSFQLQFTEDTKIYDICSYSNKFGKKTTLSVGDQLVNYVDEDENVVYCFVRYKCTREAGAFGMCEHCGKEVFWVPFIGTVAEADMHYYLPDDRVRSTRTIGYSAADLAADPTLKQFETVFDLNGHSLTNSSAKRNFLVYSTLSILDSAGGGQVICAQGTANGGNVLLSNEGGAVLNLYSGTLTNGEGAEAHERGGCIYASYGTINIYGGTITGGKAERGGNIYMTGGNVLNLYGGTISGGNASGFGGNIYAYEGTAVNMTGGVISGGYAGEKGGNLYIRGAEQKITELIMANGMITSGTAGTAGGNIYSYSDTSIVLGGVVEKGAAVDTEGTLGSGSNIYIEGNVSLTVTGAVKDPAPAVSGANIRAAGRNSVITVKGTVSGGEATSYGGNIRATGGTGIIIDGGSVTGGVAPTAANIRISGTAENHATFEVRSGKVDGGVLVGSSSAPGASDVKLVGKAVLPGIELLSGTVIDVSQMSANSAVTVIADGVFTTERDDIESIQNCFTPANSVMRVVVAGKALSLEAHKTAITEDLILIGDQAYCPACDKVVTWTAVTEAVYGESAVGTLSDGAHYYLAEDITYTGTDSFITGPGRSGTVPKTACLHLNGHDLTVRNSAAISGNSGILNVMGSGVVSGNRVWSDKTRGATININTTAETGTVNLYGGTYTKTEGNSQDVVIAAHNNGGQIFIYEDAAVQCAADEYAVYVGTSKGNNTNVQIVGAQLTGGVLVADRNTEKDFSTTVVINGAKIGGTVNVGLINSFELSGAPQIAMLDMTSGMKATVADAGLTSGAAITVKANGIFTESTDKAAEYVQYFAAAEGYEAVTVVENGLWTKPAYVDDGVLKILAIGNSYSNNATENLYDIMQAEGVTDVVIGRLFVGGCSLKMHAENAQSNAAAYSYYKNETGTWVTTTDVTMLEALQDEDWDIITMQQNSDNSGRADTYQPYLDQLIAYVNENKTNPDAKLLWHMTWAWHQSSTNENFTTYYGGDQLTMYNMIAQTVSAQIDFENDFAGLIPAGTAIQNARTSFLGDGFNSDYSHMNNLGKLVASYTWYSVLTGQQLTQINLPSIDKVVLTDAIKSVIIDAVNAAVSDPYRVTDLSYGLDPNQVDNSDLVFEENTTKAMCPVCGKMVEWTAITGSETSVALTQFGHFYLADDITVNAADNGQSGYLYASGLYSYGRACLHLNGHDLTVTGNRVLMGGTGTVNIMGNGIVSGQAKYGSTIHINIDGAASTVNLYGGTYTKAADTNLTSSVVYIANNGGTVNMYAGATIDGTGIVNSSYSPCVRVIGAEGENAVFNMYGGTIQNGGTGVSGGNVFLSTEYAIFNMFGGTVTGGTATEDGGNIYIYAGTLNLSGGTVTGGTAGGNGGNIAAVTNGVVNLSGGTVSGGTATGHGGNISMVESDLTVTGGTVTGGSGENGGNIYVYGASTEYAKLTVTGGLIGAAENAGTGDAFTYGGIASSSGGNIYLAYVDASVSGATLSGGNAVSTGGNVSLSNANMTIGEGTVISGGQTQSQGGALRIYKSTVVMTGGSICGGSAKVYGAYCNANVSLSSGSTMYMLGGTVTADPEATKPGTGIDIGGSCTLYVGGTAAVVDPQDNTVAGVYARDTSKICICDGWSGAMNFKFATVRASGDTLPADNMQVVTLDAQLNATVGGSFTGTVSQLSGGGVLPVLPQPDGSLKLE